MFLIPPITCRCDICRHFAEFWADSKTQCKGSLCETDYAHSSRLSSSLDCTDALEQLLDLGYLRTEVTVDDSVMLTKESCEHTADPFDFCERYMNC